MNTSANTLLVFTKNIIIGKVKTRLATTMGNKKALEIYKHLLSHTLSVTKNFSGQKIIFYNDFLPLKDDWVNNGFQQRIQSGNTLGDKMVQAFGHAFSQHCNKAVIIGSDCFELTFEIIQSAFDVLENNDVAIGPAADGGYYLIGIKKIECGLFQHIAWSTQAVLSQTITACYKHNLTYSLLPMLNDIDTEKDYLQYVAKGGNAKNSAFAD